MKRVDIITGASSGIGREFARQYFQKSKSDEMWLVARRKDRLDELVSELCNRTHTVEKCPVPRAVVMDISGSDGVARFKEFLESEKNLCSTEDGDVRISLLFNNAGFGTYGPFTETDVWREMQMIDLNCTALTGMCGVCLPYMERGSVILNTASLAAFLPLGNFAVYAATKSYVLSFSYALAAEVKERGVHVCTLAPGSVSTEFANVASNGTRSDVLHGKSVERVVRHAIRAIERKKHIAVMYPKWKITAVASRFIGKYFGAWWTYRFMKRPH